MNALTRTFGILAHALSGHPRAAQTVVCLGFFQRVGGPSRFDVIVTPEGGEPKKYECSHAGLKHLHAGMTPDELGLEPVPFDQPADTDEPHEGDIHDLAKWQRSVAPRVL